MSATLDMLQSMYGSHGPYIPLDLARRDFFSAYSSTKTLLRAIRAGREPLTVTRESNSLRAPVVVYLNHLASYLDQRSQTSLTTPAEPATFKHTGAQHHDHHRTA